MRSFSPSQNVRAACSCHARLAESRVAGGREGGGGLPARAQHSSLACWPRSSGALAADHIGFSCDADMQRWWRRDREVVEVGGGKRSPSRC
jgi:hypothetical protein